MDDPIPTGFITLPEALQRIVVHVSEAHLEIAKAKLQEKVQSIAAVRQSKESAESASSELSESEATGAATWGPSDQAWRHWNKRNLPLPNSSWRSKQTRSRRWFGILTPAIYSA
jgi:hypothetical protein